uniref:Uncharacterized protein n=1 Tax=Amphimedon queenslandica TaxID=400682 RepID=A0A1X7TPQ9_AMPQE
MDINLLLREKDVLRLICTNAMCHHFLDASSLGDTEVINESCIQACCLSKLGHCT